VDEDGHSLITDFAFQPNTYSDSSFCKEQIKKHAAEDNRETIIADGAYGGSENQKLAETHNVELITTALTGKAPDEVFSGFVFNEAGTEVVNCSAGKAPLKSTLYKKSGMLRVLMPKDCCSNCPYQRTAVQGSRNMPMPSWYLPRWWKGHSICKSFPRKSTSNSPG
jgi:hypothetical protein